MKRHPLNDPTMTHDSEASKKMRHENDATNDPDISTATERNDSRSYFHIDAPATTSQDAQDNFVSFDNHPESYIPNPYTVRDFVGNNETSTIEKNTASSENISHRIPRDSMLLILGSSSSNIPQPSIPEMHDLIQVSFTDTSAATSQDAPSPSCSNIPQPSMQEMHDLNQFSYIDTSATTRQEAPNLSCSNIPQPSMPEMHYLNQFSYIDTSATTSQDAPGPSCSNVNIHNKGTYMTQVENISLLKQHGVAGKEDESETCIVCESKLSEHAKEIKGRKLYFCCRCDHNTYEKEQHLKHINYHLCDSPYCKVCEVYYRNFYSHGWRECHVCKDKFECKTQFEEHYSKDEECHSVYCMLCGVKFENHLNDPGTNYECCYIRCTKVINYRPVLKNHVFSHFQFRFYKCNTCGIRLKRKETRKVHLQVKHLL